MATDAKSKGCNDGGEAKGRKTSCCVCIVKHPVKLVVAGHVYAEGNFSLTCVDACYMGVLRLTPAEKAQTGQ